jgi:hypothetical protein
MKPRKISGFKTSLKYIGSYRAVENKINSQTLSFTQLKLSVEWLAVHHAARVSLSTDFS